MSEQSKTTNLSAWKKAKRHTITLPSGNQVEIELPNLAEMIKGGLFPNDLLSIATKRIQAEELDEDTVVKLADYNRFLVATTVKKPEITTEQVPELPTEDVEMILAFANRERDLDAVGHHLSGLEVRDDFKSFRRLGQRDEDLLGL